MDASTLIRTARELVAGDRGLLAMDESTATCDKRFAAPGLLTTAEMRRAWRDLIGQAANVAAAQQALLHRTECNPAARRGDHDEAGDDAAIHRA